MLEFLRLLILEQILKDDGISIRESLRPKNHIILKGMATIYHINTCLSIY